MRRRIFSDNKIVSYDDHNKKIKAYAKSKFTMMKGIPACVPPKTIIQGTTSYICYNNADTRYLKNSSLTMYPYGIVFKNTYKQDEYLYGFENCDCL
jgi:hypothetical protein